MAEASTTPKEKNPVPHAGDHDRVTMLSVKADGTFDQHNPEIIGDLDDAKKATREQFRQQAVSAVDVAERGVTSGPVTIIGKPDGEDDEIVPLRTNADDPSVEELRAKHDKAAEASEKAADKAVDALAGDLAK